MKNVLAINNQFPTPDNKKYGLMTAVPYYRQVMPGRYLDGYRFHHLGHKMIDLDPQTAQDTVASLVREHDIVFSKHLDNPYGIYMLLGACDHYNVPLVIDFDDDIFATDGKEHNLYVYPEGSEARHYVTTLIQSATAITVSTEPLLRVYRGLNPNVFLCPNAVDPKDWNVQRRRQERFTVGWPGSTGHIMDHPVFEPAMKELAAKYPDMVFTMVGHYLPEHLEWLPRQNWELKPGIPWWSGHPKDKRTWPGVLADMGNDVGVAPLVESRYNAARSLTKWFEFTMTQTPVVASEYGPYVDLRDNEDALLVQSVDGWVNAISHLKENQHERERLVETARKRIEEEFTIRHTLPRWREVFDSLDTFRAEPRAAG